MTVIFLSCTREDGRGYAYNDAMANVTAVSVEEYLTTDYSPDCDYVDDHIEERNLGERPHSGLQTEFIVYLGMRRERWGIRVWTEQRVQTTATRFRIPDVCVTLGTTDELIFRKGQPEVFA